MSNSSPRAWGTHDLSVAVHYSNISAVERAKIENALTNQYAFDKS